ncbi:MAG: OmpH family outer membrane protein [Synergistaceae bacterium]|nr:OmpH family outer membrane protein [Synergistaceae bacterium]
MSSERMLLNRAMLSRGIILLKKALLAGLLSAAFTVATADAARGADTVGVVETQKILYQHPNFELVAKQMGERGRRKEAEIQAALEKTTDPDEQRRIVEENAREMRAEEARLMTPIDRECQDAVRTVAQKRKITVVLEKTSAYYGGTDITEEVIRQLRATVKKGELPK